MSVFQRLTYLPSCPPDVTVGEQKRPVDLGWGARLAADVPAGTAGRAQPPGPGQRQRARVRSAQQTQGQARRQNRWVVSMVLFAEICWYECFSCIVR